MRFLRFVTGVAIIILCLRFGAGASVAESTITLRVAACSKDGSAAPLLKTANSSTHQLASFRGQSLAWSRTGSVFTGLYQMKPGWIRAYVETPNCWTPPFDIAVLPGHSRHFSWFLVSKKVLVGTIRNSDIVVAGEVPLPNLRALLNADKNVVIDDGAFYVSYYHGTKSKLTLAEPEAAFISRSFSIDLRRAAPYRLFRRDVTLEEYLEQLQAWEQSLEPKPK